MKKTLLMLAMGCMASGAFAVIIETEPNNGFSSAQLISRPSGAFAEVVIASLGSTTDVDYYRCYFGVGEVLTGITTPLGAALNDPDTMLAVFDSGFNEIAFNDDANGLGSAVRVNIATAGDYYLAVTGYGDRNFDGIGHSEQGNYLLTISAVPEPGTMAALGLGAAALIRRRFKK